jgi:hypothetical protein
MAVQLIVDACKNPSRFTSYAEFQQYLKHTFHTPIFAELHEKYLGSLRSWFASYRIPDYDTSSNVIFLYETRDHYNLEFLLYNLMYFAQGWGLHIVCSSINLYRIKHILGDMVSHVRIDVLQETSEEYESGLVAYNMYMKSPTFWNSIPDTIKTLLTAEVDSYLRSPILPEMLEIDYCASRWEWEPESPGGGGITVRSVGAMKDICARLPHLAAEVFAQDCWAAEGVKQLGYTYNSTFFMEGCMQEEAIGVHQWWSFSFPMFEERRRCFEKYMILDI